MATHSASTPTKIIPDSHGNYCRTMEEAVGTSRLEQAGGRIHQPMVAFVHMLTEVTEYKD